MLNMLGGFVSVLESIGYILLALLVLVVMIVIHELGHYTAGKIFKFKINEFAIGFGKPIFKRTMKSGEIFSIRPIPLGGFCAFEGEDEEGESTDPGAFNNQIWWKRLIVLFAGAFFNFISAIIFCGILLGVVGNGRVEIKSIEGPNASNNTIQVGDVITHVEDEKLLFFNGGLQTLIADYKADQDFTITVLRQVDGKQKSMDIEVSKYVEIIEQDGKDVETAILGIKTQYKNFNFIQSVGYSTGFAFEIAWECLSILGNLLIGNLSINQIGGPVTTISALAESTSHGLINLLLWFPLIAVNLAVFNLLPIPALDGARMLFVLIEGIRKKPINRELEGKIHMFGLLFLFGFVILVDILQIFLF